MKLISLALFGLGLHAAPVPVPVPLDAPVFVPLAANPVVTVGTGTIDPATLLSRSVLCHNDLLPRATRRPTRVRRMDELATARSRPGKSVTVANSASSYHSIERFCCNPNPANRVRWGFTSWPLADANNL